MNLTFDWVSIIHIAGIINGMFLFAVIIGVKKGNRTTNRLLASLILVLVFIILSSILLSVNAYYFYPHLYGIFPKVYFALGPLLYMYIRSSISPDFIFNKKCMLHFIPLIINYSLEIPFYFQDSSEKLSRYLTNISDPQATFKVYLVIRMIHIVIYLILSYNILKRHNRRILHIHSNIDLIRLKWMKNLLISFTTILITHFTFYILAIKGGVMYFKITHIFGLWETCLLLFIGYKGFIQPEIFSGNGNFDITEKYGQSGLTPEQADAYLEQLTSYMENKKPYLESELTIQSLSRKTQIPPRYLSQILNKNLSQNFYDFINQYRTEEVKQRLLLPEYNHYTILGIAYDVGFNSKSTFNSVFKKNTETTPSQYRKKHLK